MAISDLLSAIGILLFSGFLAGRLVRRVGLPAVTGYILAGLVLNPRVWPLLPARIDVLTQPVTDICLAFITFEIGSELKYSRLRKAGARVLGLTLGESLGAWLVVALGLMGLGWAGWLEVGGVAAQALIPLVWVLASLAAPTDPTATLAVRHEYRARGPVSDTITEVAAFDDLMGIVLFAIGTHVAGMWLGNEVRGWQFVWEPTWAIGGAVAWGAVAGGGFIFFSRLLGARAEGGYIVLLLAFLAMAFGLAGGWGLDSVLVTMTMGMVVGNFHPHRRLLMQIIERYTEELVFVCFFTLGATHLDPVMASKIFPLAGLYVFLRALGKIGGFAMAGRMAGVSHKVLRWAPWGLLPQGGIVVGLALSLQRDPLFADFAQVLLAVVMAATIFHEIVGPLLAKAALSGAGEMRR